MTARKPKLLLLRKLGVRRLPKAVRRELRRRLRDYRLPHADEMIGACDHVSELN